MIKNTIGIITGILVLSLLCCDNRQQATQDNEIPADAYDTPKPEKINTLGVVKTKSLRNIRESKYRLTTENIIANELMAAKDEYESKCASSNCYDSSNYYHFRYG